VRFATSAAFCGSVPPTCMHGSEACDGLGRIRVVGWLPPRSGLRVAAAVPWLLSEYVQATQWERLRVRLRGSALCESDLAGRGCVGASGPRARQEIRNTTA